MQGEREGDAVKDGVTVSEGDGEGEIVLDVDSDPDALLDTDVDDEALLETDVDDEALLDGDSEDDAHTMDVSVTEPSPSETEKAVHATAKSRFT
jgi:hypothetical protein